MQNDFLFCIPSYGRADRQDTLKYLSALGYGKDRIIISTQTQGDYAKYQEVCKDRATVIYREGHCVGDNRNTLLCAVPIGARLVMLDDDVRSIMQRRGGKLAPINSRAWLDKVITAAFDYAIANRARIWGVYPVENAFFMGVDIDTRSLLTGTVMGIVNSGEQFDTAFTVKEDYELCCREMTSGRNVIRFNFLAARASHKIKSGGVIWNDEVNQHCANALIKKYPRLVKAHPTRKGEVKFIG